MLSSVAALPAAIATPTDDPVAETPDAVAPPPRHPRFALIDGMRTIAVICVVLVHAALFGGAFGSSLGGRLLAHLNLGVTIFFLISGFLLYRPMIAHRGGGPAAPRSRDYARRRVLRIYPAYLLALTVLLIWPASTGGIVGERWPMFALVHALPIYGGPRCIDQVTKCGLAQTWSLVVEATFYLALPLYALLITRLTRRLSLRRWLVTELASLGALSIASVVLQFVVLGSIPAWISGSVVGYCLWFAIGMGMAVASVAVEGGIRAPRAIHALGARPGALWALALAAYLALSLWLPPSPYLFSSSQQLVTHLCFALIAALLLAPAVFASGSGGLPRRLLAQPAVAWLGLVSYGVFLWHYVVALELGAEGAKASFPLVLIGTLAISIPLAAASYYLLERPLLRLK
jgi:peptidoglycan/LPS O-acetylase OafA/YrhL